MAAPALLYFKTMTPGDFKQMNMSASNNPAPDSNSTEYAIAAGGPEYGALIGTQLLPAGAIGANDHIVVAIKVAAEGPPPKRYDPLSVCITDTKEVIGIQLRDPSEYATLGIYHGIEGDYKATLGDPHSFKSTEKETDFERGQLQRWPQTFDMRFKLNPTNMNTHFASTPADAWGLCSSAANGGISLSFQYTTRLDEVHAHGLHLILYRFKSTEEYTLNMIEIAIYREGP